MDIEKFKAKAKLKNRYAKQLARLKAEKIDTQCIETAVDGGIKKLAASHEPIVIYGEPQSGKTEMMICLTARLLDNGHRTIAHLMNDSVDLLTQSLKRFKKSGIAPAPRSVSELGDHASRAVNQELVVFCKKNSRDLGNLIDKLCNGGPVVVIDDEADYATPNSKVNKGTRTPINSLVERLIGKKGIYIGVTATPARLNLNNTFKNDADKWVNFPPHASYTGQDVFFPLVPKDLKYRLNILDGVPDQDAPIEALVRFLVTVAYLNLHKNPGEENYTMLVHTSGKKIDHETDRAAIEVAVGTLLDGNAKQFKSLIKRVHVAAKLLYPKVSPDGLTSYVVENASRATLVVLNSERDRKAAGDNPTEPMSPFTIIIGGNIISRGVTFPYLLSMYFTRNVRSRLQQDTYIQRARMFGSRNKYLEHFELTIPDPLFVDWHRCFVFHRLALETIRQGMGSPVWLGDRRIAVAAKASIDKSTVTLDKGEMSFGMFDFSPTLDDIVKENQTAIPTLKKLQAVIGEEALPKFLIAYIEAAAQQRGALSLAIHTASSIANYGESADQEAISRKQGFIGRSQREEKKFGEVSHHIKILYNGKGKAKVFYKLMGSVQFVQNLRKPKKAVN